MEPMAIELLPIGRIEFRSNVRERLVEEEQVALAQSIKASGILVPLLGYREAMRSSSRTGIAGSTRLSAPGWKPCR